MSQYHDDHSFQQNHQSMAFSEKAMKLLDHWIKHNDDHALSYRQWAETFRQNGMESAATLLESAAALTGQINLALKNAHQSIDNTP